MIIKNFKSPVFSKECICDNEISNDIDEGFGNWNYEKADVVCCGILIGDEVTIYFREKNDDIDEYKKVIKKHLDIFDCLYAFNFNMEFGNFKGFLGKEYDVREIKPFRARGGSKQAFFEELIKDNLIKEKDIPIDPLENDSKECISCYEKGEYEKIITHNFADLVKQAMLLKHKDYFLEKYKDRINSKGWLDGDFRPQ